MIVQCLSAFLRTFLCHSDCIKYSCRNLQRLATYPSCQRPLVSPGCLYWLQNCFCEFFILVSFSVFIFVYSICFVLCGGLSWLSISFCEHVECVAARYIGNSGYYRLLQLMQHWSCYRFSVELSCVFQSGAVRCKEFEEETAVPRLDQSWPHVTVPVFGLSDHLQKRWRSVHRTAYVFSKMEKYRFNSLCAKQVWCW